ncbi:MAG: hypothetical protein QOJ69_1343 [Actinomycetota bacterium]|nr:hypothetical protein [Actinomycetota bacterium]MEA2843672.1 hypothetical protein [Actinomycetota bacterium]
MATGGPMHDDSPADAAFRAEARAWLAANVGPYRTRYDPTNPSLVFADVSDTDHVTRGKAWQRVLHEGGYSGLGWPAEFGGRPVPLSQRVIWAQETAAAGAPPGINLIGEGMVGPTLLAHGTADQKRRYLPPLLRGDEIWCQLFSEPDAGTDLAAVTTTAAREGEGDGGWVVTGHKLWTSAAHYADFGILLARTDWDVPKHQGCTYFLVDMRAPGVTTRPLRQMTGGAAFNEVFLDRVPVADAQRVGAEGDGWAVAVTTLLAERLNLGLGLARVGGGIQRMLSDLRPHGVADHPVVRQLAARLWTDAKVLEVLGERIVSKLARGEVPGPEGAVARLASIRVSRRSDELLDALRGAGGMLVDEYTLLQLWIPATRIAGGTEEALRSIVAERVLGLPREPRADKDVPFREVPVGRVGRRPMTPGDGG